MGEDWLAWHQQYGDPASALSQRLRAVRQRLAEALDEAGPSARILSLCAGDGRDVIPVLAQRAGGAGCAATLVELSPVLADRARQQAQEMGVNVSVVVADAGLPNAYEKASPADVLLLCGIFGNVSDDDVFRTVTNAGSLVRRGGRVIWTRHRRAPDLTPTIRTWFTDAGFAEIAFDASDTDAWAVGVAVNRTASDRAPDARLFTFIR